MFEWVSNTSSDLYCRILVLVVISTKCVLVWEHRSWVDRNRAKC